MERTHGHDLVDDFKGCAVIALTSGGAVVKNMPSMQET